MMFKAVVEFPNVKGLREALIVIKSSERAKLSLLDRAVVIEAKDPTALRAMLNAVLRIMQSIYELEYDRV